MNIEIHQPRLEALINQRMASGPFQSVEDLLLQMFEADQGSQLPEPPPKQNFSDFLKESPLWGSGLTVERSKDLPRKVDL